jgi:hypothetical protein
MVQWRDWEK